MRHALWKRFKDGLPSPTRPLVAAERTNVVGSMRHNRRQRSQRGFPPPTRPLVTMARTNVVDSAPLKLTSGHTHLTSSPVLPRMANMYKDKSYYTRPNVLNMSC